MDQPNAPTFLARRVSRVKARPSTTQDLSQERRTPGWGWWTVRTRWVDTTAGQRTNKTRPQVWSSGAHSQSSTNTSCDEKQVWT